MDTNMDDVDFVDGDETPVPSNHAPSDAESATAYSDDNEVGASSASQTVKSRGAVYFVDSEDEDFFSRGTEHVRKNKGGRTIGSKKRTPIKKKPARKPVGKRAAINVDQLSHLSTAPENDDNEQLSETANTPTTTRQSRERGESSSLFVPEVGDTSPVTESSRDRSESLSLFIPEDEDPALVVKGSTELNRPVNKLRRLPNMDGLKRARNIKAEIENNISVLQPQEKKTSTRRNVEEDPENQLIKTLRQDQHMNWNDIANFLNQERRNRGEAANFTDAAVYSRFVRNAPRIAAAVGEIGFDPKDYMHLRHPNQYSHGEGTGTISKAGKKRVKNFDNATELKANMRKQLKLDEHVDLESAEKTEQLMDAVAKVERNFWILVADEMERSTTKLYDPNTLASRYHAI